MMNSIQNLHKEIYSCKKCQTKKQIKSPFLGLGNFNSWMMFIAERPGYQTTSSPHGITLLGNKSGDFFFKCLAEVGLSINDIYITNIVKCQEKNNRIPDNDEILTCSKYLEKEIEIIQPTHIIIMGKVAFKHFFPEHNSIMDVAGTVIVKGGVYHLILPHPIWAVRFGETEKYKKWFKIIGDMAMVNKWNERWNNEWRGHSGQNTTTVF